MKEVSISIMIAVIASVIGGIFLFTAFHEEDRRPVLAHNKGIYSGTTPAPLDEDLVNRLRQRALWQAAPSPQGPVTGGSFVGLAGSNVRPPEPSPRLRPVPLHPDAPVKELN